MEQSNLILKQPDGLEVVQSALVLFSFSSMSHVCVADVNKGAVMVLIYIVSSDEEDQGYLF